MREVAIEYAKAGYRVLPLHGLAANEDGELICKCGKPCGKSAGKHPIPQFAPHGANDGTTDLDLIDAWPLDGYNLGLSLSNTLVSIDIDDEEVSAALSQIPIWEKMPVTSTGRGLHLWLQCAPSQNSIPKLANGIRLGEIRAAGYLVVIPPSRHRLGSWYEWPGQTLLKDGPLKTNLDARTWLEQCLSEVGCKLADKSAASSAEAPEDIAPIDLPWKSKNPRLKLLLNPEYQVIEDRSGELFHLACEIIRDAEKASEVISDKAVAGIIWKADIQRGRIDPRGPKFAFRGTAAGCYWDLVQNARAAIKQADEKLKQQAARGTYYYDPDDGFIDQSVPSRPVRLATFEARIIERLIPWTGDADVDSEAEPDWVMRFTRKDETYTLRLNAEKYGETRAFEKTVRVKLPPKFGITPGKVANFLAAIQIYSGDVPIRQCYAAAGWLPGTDKFLMPYPGLLTENGFEEGITYENPNAPPIMQQYGVGMRAGVGDELERYLRLVFTMASPEVVTRLLLQALAAPLASLGVASSAPIVHLTGRSGSMKTSLARIAMSMYGRFSDESQDRIGSWYSTGKGLQLEWAAARDLPFLTDDFKQQRFDLTPAIQSYGDRIGRTVSARDGRAHSSPSAKCLLISTGENVWTGNESTIARTLTVDVRKDEVNLEILTQVQKVAAAHDLPVIGYEWIRWLCEKGQKKLASVFAEQREKNLETARDAVGQTGHNRLIYTISALRVVGSFVESFIRARAPGFLEEYREISAAGWVQTVDEVRVQNEEGENYSPWNALVGEIHAAIASGEAWLMHRYQGGQAIGSTAGSVCGFVDNSAVHLTEKVTFAWYENRLHHRGTPNAITWLGFRAEAKHHHGAPRAEEAVLVHTRGRFRTLRISLEEFFPNGVPQQVTAGAEEL